MKSTFLTVLLFTSFMSCAQEKIPDASWQLKTAVLAAPEGQREGAKVYGYDSNGNMVVLREGTNQYVCLADNPENEGFQTAAYHKDLDDFMTRGRELRSQGKGFQEVFDTRENEVKSGKLKMPDRTTLFIFSGDVNSETKEIENQKVRYVVYIPYATAESTGLPDGPKAPGHPWIMDPGTHRAHIMITPQYAEKEN